MHPPRLRLFQRSSGGAVAVLRSPVAEPAARITIGVVVLMLGILASAGVAMWVMPPSSGVADVTTRSPARYLRSRLNPPVRRAALRARSPPRQVAINRRRGSFSAKKGAASQGGPSAALGWNQRTTQRRNLGCHRKPAPQTTAGATTTAGGATTTGAATTAGATTTAPFGRQPPLGPR
jgi:hypothetical protein